MLVLIADKFEQSGQDGLNAIGCKVSYQPELKDEKLVAAIQAHQPDVLVVRSTKVTEPMMAAGPIKLVVRAGAGFNTIDVAAASRRGIYVSNCPGKNSIAVAELVNACPIISWISSILPSRTRRASLSAMPSAR